MKLFISRALLFGLLLASCSDPSGNASADTPIFSIQQKNQDDQITIRLEEPGAVIDIASPTGIGSAVFVLETGLMPASIRVRLHLSGLEQVRIMADNRGIAASLSSHDPLQSQDQQMIGAGGEISISPASPMWMDIQIVSPNGTSVELPLKQGYFEARVPNALMESVESSGSFEINWIDFYR